MRSKIKSMGRIKIGGVAMSTKLINRVVELLVGFDRMPENPDLGFLRRTVERQLSEDGLLRLLVFVCPKFATVELFGKSSWKYIPESANEKDLFTDRIAKILEIRRALYDMGVVSLLDVVIGDNDFETYLLPFLPNLEWNRAKVLDRQKLYLSSFQKRVQELFGNLASVWSLGDLGVTVAGKGVVLSKEQLASEIKFFEWLLSEEGPYKGKLAFNPKQLQQIIQLKYRAYGAQGDFLEELGGGILLQTEGPGVWLQRTEMLRCTGSEGVPAIYPWIRREEVAEIKNQIKGGS